MSNNKWILLNKGLLAAVACGLAVGIGAGADEPIARERTPSRSTRADKDAYLLLTDGRLIQGVVSRDDTTYTVTQRLGVIRFPAGQVERSFDTIQEAYRYKLERLPEEDPEERLRLARWCLSVHLTQEARSQLEKLLEISPAHGPAKAMLLNLARSGANRTPAAEMKVDVGVQQAGAEEVVEDRPGALDSAVLRGAERRMGITGRPVIFDLPPAVAARRAEEFRQYVHPILQTYCARCHDAEYDGEFRLARPSNSRQRNSGALRTNLDATLRLVDPENPAKSELLSSTIRPHGPGARTRPIFAGSNSREYRILAAWVNGLRPSADGEMMRASAGRTTEEPGEAFASDRGRYGAATLDQVARGIRTGDPRRLPSAANPGGKVPAGPAFRYAEGQGMVPEDLRQADPQEFPLPYMLGGPRPGVPGASAARGQGTTPTRATRAPRPPADEGAARGDQDTPTAEPAAERPGGQDAAAPPASGSPASKAKKKPVKIDPALLERLLQRNANRPAGQ